MAAACAIQRLPPLPTVRDLIRLYKLRALKHFSQNFLLDQRITDRIVRSAGRIRDGHVLEVGPGPGSITRSILRQGPKHLVLVEKDKRFTPTLELLEESVRDTTKVDIIHGDILKFNCQDAFPDLQPTEWEGPPHNVHIIGNLPFAISTRLLINWLKDISLKRGAWSNGRTILTLTFQKEVAERMVAEIGQKNRCRLSLMSQFWATPIIKFIIPGTAFVPKPDVDVGVVTLVPLKTPRTDLPFDLVEKVMRYIFSMRQKFVRRGVRNLFPPKVQDDLTAYVFRTCEIEPELRSFQLSNEECLRIAQTYYNIIQEYPEIDAYNYRCPKVERGQWDNWDF